MALAAVRRTLQGSVRCKDTISVVAWWFRSYEAARALATERQFDEHATAAATRLQQLYGSVDKAPMWGEEVLLICSFTAADRIAEASEHRAGFADAMHAEMDPTKPLRFGGLVPFEEISNPDVLEEDESSGWEERVLVDLRALLRGADVLAQERARRATQLPQDTVEELEVARQAALAQGQDAEELMTLAPLSHVIGRQASLKSALKSSGRNGEERAATIVGGGPGAARRANVRVRFAPPPRLKVPPKRGPGAMPGIKRLISATGSLPVAAEAGVPPEESQGAGRVGTGAVPAMTDPDQMPAVPPQEQACAAAVDVAAPEVGGRASRKRRRGEHRPAVRSGRERDVDEPAASSEIAIGPQMLQGYDDVEMAGPDVDAPSGSAGLATGVNSAVPLRRMPSPGQHPSLAQACVMPDESDLWTEADRVCVGTDAAASAGSGDATRARQEGHPVQPDARLRQDGQTQHAHDNLGVAGATAGPSTVPAAGAAVTTTALGIGAGAGAGLPAKDPAYMTDLERERARRAEENRARLAQLQAEMLSLGLPAGDSAAAKAVEKRSKLRKVS